MTSDVQTSSTAEQAIANPFDVVALLLMKARLSLSETRDGSGYPRYARILRSKNSEGNKTIQDIVSTGTHGFTHTVSKLIDLTLDARDLLDDVDALVALSEVGIDIIRTVTSDPFIQSLRASFTITGGSTSVEGIAYIGSAIGGLDGALKNAQDFLRFVPAPEDLERIGYELYRLACIQTSGNSDAVRQNTGKARLLQWGFDLGWEVTYAVGTGKKFKASHLGKLPFLERPEKLAVSCESILIYSYQGVADSNGTTDVTDAISMLHYLNYPMVGTAVVSILEKPVSDANVVLAVKQFQYYNEIPVSGNLDNETMNRLFNLDSTGKNVKRAVPCRAAIVFEEDSSGGYLNLINGNADRYADEAIQPISSRGKSYYQVGKNYHHSPGSAWALNPESFLPAEYYAGNYVYQGLHENDISDDGRKLVHGFVALQSRYKTHHAEPFFEGGIFSEGEAAEGEFFFAARHTEPWRQGRGDRPGQDALFESADMSYEKTEQLLKGSVSQMFQLVDIPLSVFKTFERYGDKCELVFYAHCLQRSLYRDTIGGMPDRGRIQLQLLACDQNKRPTERQQASGKKYLNTFGEFSATPLWMPDKKLTADILNNPSLDRKTTWFLQQSQRWTISKTAYAGMKEHLMNGTMVPRAKVLVEGLHSSSWDIDAYFDDIRIRWQIVIK